MCRIHFFYLRKKSTWLKSHCIVTPPPITSTRGKDDPWAEPTTAGDWQYLLYLLHLQQSEDIMKVLSLKDSL